MNAVDIVRAAIPDAGEDVVSHILWGRTPFPCGPITAQSLYRAASSWRRACDNGLRLCELCHRVAVDNWTCQNCEDALERIRRERDEDQQIP